MEKKKTAREKKSFIFWSRVSALQKQYIIERITTEYIPGYSGAKLKHNGNIYDI
jgi:hypothetical protein